MAGRNHASHRPEANIAGSIEVAIQVGKSNHARDHDED